MKEIESIEDWKIAYEQKIFWCAVLGFIIAMPIAYFTKNQEIGFWSFLVFETLMYLYYKRKFDNYVEFKKLNKLRIKAENKFYQLSVKEKIELMKVEQL